MASPRLSRIALLTSLVAVTGIISGCASPAAPQPTETVITTAPTPTATSPQSVTPTVAPADVDVTCDTLVSGDILKDLAAKGWTAKEEPFVVANSTLPDGLQCTWADFGVSSGVVFIFGWAPISADQAEAAQQQLAAQGWIVEDTDEGLYVTEDPTRSLTGEDGTGMTYQFGDGWVTVADTKQNLLLIERPAG